MEYIVVKMGGSLLSPHKELVDENVVKGYVGAITGLFKEKMDVPRLVLVVGGGGLSRKYRDISQACGGETEIDQHRIGITATWLNAELIRSLLGEIAFQNVLGVGVYAENRQEAEKMMANDFERWLKGDKPVLVTGGFINGASTDFNAVLLASKIGVDRFYKLTDVDHVYTSDPKKDMSAKPFEDISWVELFRLFDVSFDEPTHAPSAHIPVDLFAARLAHDNQIGCFLADGRDPSAITNIYNNTLKVGTFIH